MWQWFEQVENTEAGLTYLLLLALLTVPFTLPVTHRVTPQVW
jgi:hypothetical protein